MTANETIRINKVVKELNIGIGTLVDFLKKKGIEVDPSPNSKISTEAYLLAQKEFDKEHLLKEQSKKIIFKIVEPEHTVPLPVPEKPVAPKIETERIVKDTLPPLQENVSPRPALIKEVVPEQPVIEEAPKVVAQEEVTQEKGPSIKVVGKIDLTPKPKKRPSKQKQGHKPKKDNHQVKSLAPEKPKEKQMPIQIQKDIHVEVEYHCHAEYTTPPHTCYAYIPVIESTERYSPKN